MKGGTGWHDFLDLGNVFGFRITDVYLENDVDIFAGTVSGLIFLR